MTESATFSIKKVGDGVISPEVPTSTLEELSYERNQLTVPLQTTMMSCYERTALSQFMREEGRLKFFCRREIQTSAMDLSACPPANIVTVISCLDDLFGVEAAWPKRLAAGQKHRFVFIGSRPSTEGEHVDDSHLPDRVLINGGLAWERTPGESTSFAIEYVPSEDEHPVFTLVKDREFTLRGNPDRFFPGTGPPAHPILRLFVHLSLDLQVACQHLEEPGDPAKLEAHPLPGEFRRFCSPGPFAFPQDFDPPEWNEPPLVLPDYPTEKIYIHDIADSYENQNAIDGHPEMRAQQDQLCLDNGIMLFPVERADWLEEQGLKDSDRVGFLLQVIIIRGLHGRLGEGVSDEALAAECARQGKIALDLLERFPSAMVFVRLVEFSGCQYHCTNYLKSAVESTNTTHWSDYCKATDETYRKVHEQAFGAARKVGGERFKIYANIQQLNYISAHAFRCGADFTMDKTIGRESLNLIVASSRGHNLAYGSEWVGMQHDNWGAIRFNYDGFTETRFIWRAFYLGGANVMDRETIYVGVRDGKVVPNRKGQGFLRAVRWMNRHPLRGTPRVRIAYMRGSDSMAGWGYPLSQEQSPKSVDGADPYRPKEMADWDLLSVAFPGVLTDCRRNNLRWMTGTPFGPADLIPWDTPAERLAEYGVIVMIGEHTFESDEQIDSLVSGVEAGATLVCSLSAFYGERTKGQVYYTRDLKRLAGVELDEDVSLWVMRSLPDQDTNVTRHYNRVHLEGAKVLGRLPNGDPWIVEHTVGSGRVLFFTTDRLTDLGYAPAAAALQKLFEPLRPVSFSDDSTPPELGLFRPIQPPQITDREQVTYAGAASADGYVVDQTTNASLNRTSWLDVSVFQKEDLRIIAVQDYGRARVPTDNGPDLGLWEGTVTLHLHALGLDPHAPLEVLSIDESMRATRLPATLAGENLELRLTIDGLAELAIGPEGRSASMFYGSEESR